MTLTEIAAVKFNHDTRADDHQTVMHASRRDDHLSVGRRPHRAFAQLIASAGLSPSEARGMSLTEIAAYKFDRDTPNDD